MMAARSVAKWLRSMLSPLAAFEAPMPARSHTTTRNRCSSRRRSRVQMVPSMAQPWVNTSVGAPAGPDCSTCSRLPVGLVTTVPSCRSGRLRSSLSERASSGSSRNLPPNEAASSSSPSHKGHSGRTRTRSPSASRIQSPCHHCHKKETATARISSEISTAMKRKTDRMGIGRPGRFRKATAPKPRGSD